MWQAEQFFSGVIDFKVTLAYTVFFLEATKSLNGFSWFYSVYHGSIFVIIFAELLDIGDQELYTLDEIIFEYILSIT